MSAFTSIELEAATRRIATRLERESGALDRLDAMTGDGDTGSTLAIVARALLADTAPFPDDIGACFNRIARTISRSSGSSLSSVIMSGMFSLSQQTKGATKLSGESFLEVFRPAVEDMQKTSRAAFGDKTILDSFKAIADIDGRSGDVAADALRAAEATRRDFVMRPSVIGRARLASNRGVGQEDPGMAALVLALKALVGPDAIGAAQTALAADAHGVGKIEQ